MGGPPDTEAFVEIVIGYDHRYRKVYATDVYKSKAGKWIITAWDPDAEEGEGGWRSFRVDRLNGSVHFVRRTNAEVPDK